MAEIPGKYDTDKLILYLKGTKDEQKSIETHDYERVKEAIAFNKNAVISSARDLYKIESEISEAGKFGFNKLSNPSYKELVSKYKKTKQNIVELGEQIRDIYKILPEGSEKNEIIELWSDFSLMSDKLSMHFENYTNQNIGFHAGNSGGITFSNGFDIKSALKPLSESGLLDDKAVRVISEKYLKIMDEIKNKGGKVERVRIFVRNTDDPIDLKEIKKMMEHFDTDDDSMK